MLAAGLAFAAVAALLHVFIFWLESVAFGTRGRAVFGVGAADVPVVAPWAFNQGCYNLFLAVGTGIGIAMTALDAEGGPALVVFGTATMLGAAAVLVVTDRTKARAAAIQGGPPALALVALAAHAIA